ARPFSRGKQHEPGGSGYPSDYRRRRAHTHNIRRYRSDPPGPPKPAPAQRPGRECRERVGKEQRAGPGAWERSAIDQDISPALGLVHWLKRARERWCRVVALLEDPRGELRRMLRALERWPDDALRHSLPATHERVPVPK